MAEKVATIGNVPIYKIDSIYLVILCTKTLNIPNVGTAIKSLGNVSQGNDSRN